MSYYATNVTRCIFLFVEGAEGLQIFGFQQRVRARGLGWLKRGFRHCFAYRQVSDGWLLCDPLSDELLLRSAPALPPRGLMTSLAALGASVVSGEFANTGRAACWFRPLNCVEICKRLAGCNEPRVITPHNLFMRLSHPTARVVDRPPQ